MINCPIYRAKTIDDNKYIEGYFYPDTEYPLILNCSWTDLDSSDGIYVRAYKIDPSTIKLSSISINVIEVQE